MNTSRLVRRGPRRFLVALAGASLLLSSSVLVIDATTTTKTYAAAIPSGATVFAGGTYNGAQYPNLRLSITNTTNPQALGSANIIVPPGITLLYPSTGQPAAVDDPNACFNLSFSDGRTVTIETACYVTSSTFVTATGASVTGPVIGLRNLTLAPNTSVTVTFPARVACSGGTGGSWLSEVKQSNDFNGTPGNDFVLTGSPPSSTIVGTCSLSFTPTPANAQRNLVITGSPFNTSGPAVAVTIFDGSGSQPVIWWGTVPPVHTISLSFNTNPGSAQLFGGLVASPNTAGVATFTPMIDVSASGYSLRATTVLETVSASANSTPFIIVDTGKVCPANQTCPGNATGNRSSTSLNAPIGANGGTLAVSIGPVTAVSFECAGYTTTTEISDFDVTGGSTFKTITIELFSLYATRSASQYQVCFRAPYQFTTRAGSPAVYNDCQGFTPSPNTALACSNGGGTPFFVGLLPDCASKNPVAPCTQTRTSDKQKNVFVTFIATPLPADPGGKF